MTVWCGESNRILDAVVAMRERFVDLPESRVTAARRMATLSQRDLGVFQEWKSLAQAEGLLTLDESLSVYAALGEAGETRDAEGWPIDTDTAQRIVVFKLMQELGTYFIARRRLEAMTTGSES
jgi:hypothetical protein